VEFLPSADQKIQSWLGLQSIFASGIAGRIPELDAGHGEPAKSRFVGLSETGPLPEILTGSKISRADTQDRNEKRE
jgi:hypothetical protein